MLASAGPSWAALPPSRTFHAMADIYWLTGMIQLLSRLMIFARGSWFMVVGLKVRGALNAG